MQTCTRCKQQFPKTLEYFYKKGKYLRSDCKQCFRAYRSAHHEANKEKENARSRAWKKANPKKHNANSKAWRDANLEKENARKKAWREANLEKVNALNRKQARKRRAQKRDNGFETYTEQQMFDTYGTNCYLCDMPIDLDAPRRIGYPPKKVKGMWHFWRSGLHTEHFIPITLGGSDTLDNVRPSHGWCNLSKGTK